MPLSKLQIDELEKRRKYEQNEMDAVKLNHYAERLRDIKRAIDRLQSEHETLWNKESVEFRNTMTLHYNDVYRTAGIADGKAHKIRKENKF